MKIHRFIDNFDLSNKELEIKGEIAHQIIKVLRLKIGEKIELCNEESVCALSKIKNITEKEVLVDIENMIQKDNTEKQNKVTLFCTILKKENFEIVVQKSTECGVYKIVPVISSHTIKTGLNLERLEKIAKEASEQSGRTYVPEITEIINFEKSLEFVNKNDLNILFDKSGEFLNKIEKNSPNINLWIGPEGGWTEKEIQKAKENKFIVASLGDLTLRAETAAIISTYLTSNIK